MIELLEGQQKYVERRSGKRLQFVQELAQKMGVPHRGMTFKGLGIISIWYRTRLVQFVNRFTPSYLLPLHEKLCGTQNVPQLCYFADKAGMLFMVCRILER